MSTVQVYQEEEPELKEVRYYMHQHLQVFVSKDSMVYEACIEYGEGIEAGETEPFERSAVSIDLKEVPATELAEVRTIVAQYLRDRDIVVDSDTEWITQ